MLIRIGLEICMPSSIQQVAQTIDTCIEIKIAIPLIKDKIKRPNRKYVV